MFERALCWHEYNEVSAWSWGLFLEAASCEVTSWTLWNTKVLHHFYKCPPLVPTLNHTNPVHTTPSHLSKIRLNIIHPLVLVFLVFCYFWLSHQHMHSFSFPFVLRVHLPRLDNVIILGEEYKLQWLRHYATSRKVTGSRLDEANDIIFRFT
jgi:hypothetical protein